MASADRDMLLLIRDNCGPHNVAVGLATFMVGDDAAAKHDRGAAADGNHRQRNHQVVYPAQAHPVPDRLRHGVQDSLRSAASLSTTFFATQADPARVSAEHLQPF